MGKIQIFKENLRSHTKENKAAIEKVIKSYIYTLRKTMNQNMKADKSVFIGLNFMIAGYPKEIDRIFHEGPRNESEKDHLSFVQISDIKNNEKLANFTKFPQRFP